MSEACCPCLFDPASGFVLHSGHMRRVVGGVAAVAFAAMFVQSPWAHAHTANHDSDHYQQEHRASGSVHRHGLGAAAHRPEWRDHDAQTDARFLGPVVGVFVSSITADVVFDRSDGVPEPQLSPIQRHADFAPRAHGPPLLGTLPPRAPPA
jgi:hypothetical protein